MKIFGTVIVIIISHIIQGITGFAGTLIAMPWTSMLIGFGNARGMMNLITILSCLIIAITSYKLIDWKELFKIVGVMSIGLICGIQLIKVLDVPQLLYFYGIFIIIIACRGIVMMYKGVHSEKENRWLSYLILIFAGVIHGMYVSGGALVVIYATKKIKDKKVFRVTVSMIWIILNTFIGIEDVISGSYSPEIIKYFLICTIPCLVATYIGVKLQKYLSIRMFLGLSYVLLVISGLTMLI